MDDILGGDGLYPSSEYWDPPYGGRVVKGDKDHYWLFEVKTLVDFQVSCEGVEREQVGRLVVSPAHHEKEICASPASWVTPTTVGVSTSHLRCPRYETSPEDCEVNPEEDDVKGRDGVVGG